MDSVFRKFLENSLVEAMKLHDSSDVLHIAPLPPAPPQTYLCEFNLPHLQRQPDGVAAVVRAPILCAVHLPDDYLRSADSRLFLKVAAVVSPQNLIHPNVAGGAVCLGSRFAPGTPLRALLWELYEIFAYRNFTLVESNALNPEACRLLRQHPGILKRLAPPPLLKQKRRFRIEVTQ